MSSRRTSMSRLLALLPAVSALAVCGSPVVVAAESAPVAMTASGAVHGTDQDGVRRFQGIPYAAPPVGGRRWRLPQPVSPWAGLRDATQPGPVCMQPAAPDMPRGIPQSEDCLTLNVTSPARPRAGRPVMVWIPGGGFITGAGSIYDPARLVEESDTVVVTVNYRLGVFGFFAHPELGDSSNFGLQDQLAALRWVHDNIADFGGDPGRVTLAGESAGAMSACTLMTSPAAGGLFQQAVVQSGSCLMSHPAGAFGEDVGAISTWQPLSAIQGTGAAMADRLSCADVACLRGKPASELLSETTSFPLIAYGTSLVPGEPAEVFTAGREAAVPLLQGNTHDEHVEFTLNAYPDGITAEQYSTLLRTAFGHAAPHVERQYPVREFPSPAAAASRVFSDRDWICASWKSGRYHAREAPTYAYVFTDPTAPTISGLLLPDNVRPATAHGGELAYLFDFPAGPRLTDDQRRLADQLVGYWARFVRNGDPNGAGNQPWPRLDVANRALRLAPGTTRTINVATTHHCQLWNTPGPQ